MAVVVYNLATMETQRPCGRLYGILGSARVHGKDNQLRSWIKKKKSGSKGRDMPLGRTVNPAHILICFPFDKRLFSH